MRLCIYVYRKNQCGMLNKYFSAHRKIVYYKLLLGKYVNILFCYAPEKIYCSLLL